MTLRAIAKGVVQRAVGGYFELSYRLLDSESGRRLLEESTEPGAPAVHGYTGAEDIRVLTELLTPSPGSTVLDLGSGLGAPAILVHGQSGARVVGIEQSRRAVAAARRRAATAGVQKQVRFLVGNLALPPGSAAAAYALDSLTFVLHPEAVISTVVEALEPPARLFATVLTFGRDGAESLRGSLETAGLRILRFDDVTLALATRSRARRAVARRLLRSGASGRGGAFPLGLVWLEETVVGALVGAGVARRWRVVVEKSRSG
jgi:SAM-dependent methyltransferase